MHSLTLACCLTTFLDYALVLVAKINKTVEYLHLCPQLNSDNLMKLNLSSILNYDLKLKHSLKKGHKLTRTSEFNTQETHSSLFFFFFLNRKEDAPVTLEVQELQLIPVLPEVH